jgi:hypothetical protein
LLRGSTGRSNEDRRDPARTQAAIAWPDGLRGIGSSIWLMRDDKGISNSNDATAVSLEFEAY